MKQKTYVLGLNFYKRSNLKIAYTKGSRDYIYQYSLFDINLINTRKRSLELLNFSRALCLESVQYFWAAFDNALEPLVFTLSILLLT